MTMAGTDRASDGLVVRVTRGQAGGRAARRRAGQRRRPPATFAAMPIRRQDPQRLLAALSEQRAELGSPAWAGPLTPGALGDGCVAAVAAALDAGAAPCGEALRAAVVRLLALLAARAPGRAVEVRIPPYAAIQCVPGPRHTRGTPPNVVETDAATWVRLATGRLAWAAAAADGRIRASGPRADLTEYLPASPGAPASDPASDPPGDAPG
jgi:Bacterial SCP ortholog